eukprot:CAMPEP_0119324400 /NCGR_PEP_ID=MMETSP1333-20130426/63108_1 /TAXON_ID=418940 /ORGANISM="Scyphosphaera apsteinii, Strain RCC1455" /LENGTH=1057 /DNA_ID=CAMNT_0007332091 /DNA_START=141 /DNA_END=3314 /DNA_ORIENTATION=+
MSSPFEEFSRAVLCSFDQTIDPRLRSTATSSLEGLKNSADGWTFCLQALSVTAEDRVKFWCLQALVNMVQLQQRYITLTEQQQTTMRGALVAWVQSKGALQTDEPAFVKNKFAQLVVGVMKIDYPQRWPELFPQLLAALQNGPVAIDVFLRVLNTINDEVVSAEGGGFDSQVASRIKDGMREQCLPQITDAWHSILQLHESAPALAAAGLHTIHLYVSWIDISLIANGRFMEAFLKFLHQPQLHEGACLCLSEVVSKRMDAVAKLEHLTRLSIVSRLADAASSSVQLSSAFAALSSAVSLELLDCWDRLTVRGAPSVESSAMAEQASSLLRQSMPLLLTCFGATDIEVSQCTMGFLHSYVGRLRKLLPSPKDVAEHSEHLQHLLVAMTRKAVHPDGYCFEDEDEAEEAFISYRREISTLFKGVARVHASLAQAFVQNTLDSTLANLENAPWTFIEVALWLLFQLGEGLPDGVIREKGGVFQQMMSTLLKSSASAHPHHAVQLLYFEIVVRYYRFFLAQPDLLGGALQCFLDRRGLYNHHQAVRSRVCYLLLRFIKQTLKSATRDFLEMVTQLTEVLLLQRDDSSLLGLDGRGLNGLASAASHEALVNSFHQSCDGCTCRASTCTRGSRGGNEDGGTGDSAVNGDSLHSAQLTLAEQLNLYEVCGLLLGAGLAPSEQVGEKLEALLSKPLQQLQALCTCGLSLPPPSASSDSAADQQLFAARAAAAAHCISVVAVVSKGFCNLAGEQQHGGGGLPRAAFSHAMKLALSALHPFGKFSEVRARAIMLLHRVVETLPDGLVDFLNPALPQLLASADSKEVQEVVTLVNQLVLKFKAKLAPTITQLVGPLTSAIFSLVASLDSAIANSSSSALPTTGPQSDEVRERRGLMRSYYSFLHSLVHNELIAVLADPLNAPHVGTSLRALLQGCVEGPDLQLQRQCFVVLQRLVESWGGSDSNFDAYVLSDILPVCFQALAQPHFKLSDAASLPLVEAVVNLQKVMLNQLGARTTCYLRDTHLPSLGCSAEFCADYSRLLEEGDVRQLRDFLRQQLALVGEGHTDR